MLNSLDGRKEQSAVPNKNSDSKLRGVSPNVGVSQNDSNTELQSGIKVLSSIKQIVRMKRRPGKAPGNDGSARKTCSTNFVTRNAANISNRSGSNHGSSRGTPG